MDKNEEIFNDILNPFIPIYLDVRINTDPLISLEMTGVKKNKKNLDLIDRFKEGFEDAEFVLKMFDWIKKLSKSNIMKKRLKLYFDNLNEQSVFISRLLDHNSSSNLIDSKFDSINKETYKKMAHFVWTIPEEEVRENGNLILNN